MTVDIARVALVSVGLWGVVALTMLYRGSYLIAGMSFLFVSFSLYVYETRK